MRFTAYGSCPDRFQPLMSSASAEMRKQRKKMPTDLCLSPSHVFR